MHSRNQELNHGFECPTVSTFRAISAPQSVWFLPAARGPKASRRAYLDDLQLDALVGLRALEAVADGLHQPVDEPLARRPAVRGVARDVAVRDQLLSGRNRARVRRTGQLPESVGGLVVYGSSQ